MNDKENSEGLDIVGFGKIAKAIPEQVYDLSTKTLLSTFEKLTAPITEATAGFGRYLRQKFDNMVEAEKAIATYTVEKALVRARSKAKKTGRLVRPPLHPKSFVKAVEESSKETDPLLHEMWTNLLASQLIDDQSHPHFVEILPHFSPAEAHILVSLLPRSDIGKNEGGYIFFTYDSFEYWIRKNGDSELNKWTMSCVLLCEFHFADIVAPESKKYDKKVTILYRTFSGQAFLDAVTP